MPLLSQFTPLGHLRMSSAPAHGQRFYGALMASLGNQYNVEPGSRMDGFCYAVAMGLARSRYTLERAGDQADPHRVYENLPAREDEYGLVPTPGDTIPERRAALASRMLLPGGANRVNVTNALRELLGDDFVAYRPCPKDEAIVWPLNLGDQPMNLQRPEVPRRLVRLMQNISTGLGAPQAVTYERFTPLPGFIADYPELRVGEQLVVHPENDALMERVEVLASWLEPVGETSYVLMFSAAFTKPHPAGVLMTTAPFPYWVSSKRHNVIVLKAAAAADPEKRRQVNELLGRMLRGVSTWDIAAESTPGHAGPFKVGEGLLGVTPIGDLTL